jgi:hypothetical protein
MIYKYIKICDVVRHIVNGDRVFAMCAPAVMAQVCLLCCLLLFITIIICCYFITNYYYYLLLFHYSLLLIFITFIIIYYSVFGNSLTDCERVCGCWFLRDGGGRPGWFVSPCFPVLSFLFYFLFFIFVFVFVLYVYVLL